MGSAAYQFKSTEKATLSSREQVTPDSTKENSFDYEKPGLGKHNVAADKVVVEQVLVNSNFGRGHDDFLSKSSLSSKMVRKGVPKNSDYGSADRELMGEKMLDPSESMGLNSEEGPLKSPLGLEYKKDKTNLEAKVSSKPKHSKRLCQEDGLASLPTAKLSRRKNQSGPSWQSNQEISSATQLSK
ncbi:hypothetical protein Ancab_027427 [Ancistrocladus abbreviatus]